MLYTNQKVSLETALDNQLKKAQQVDICVGFVGLKTIEKYSPHLKSIAQKGRVRLIIGMYQTEGNFSQSLYTKLTELHQSITKASTANGITGSGVFITLEPYHGKIYVFSFGTSKLVWLGSSNFSPAGLADRLEASATISDKTEIANIQEYVDSLCNPKAATTIDKFAFTKAPNINEYDELPKIASLPSNLKLDGTMELRLNVSKQPKSALNLCFSAGRVNKAGIYTPRPWYEIELSIDKKDRANPLYPQTTNVKASITNQKEIRQCKFRAFLYDGRYYRQTELSTYSDYNKALGSDPRSILGEFIKGQLEKAGVLRRGEKVTDETLAEYGRNSVTLARYTDTNMPDTSDLRNKVYVLEF